MPFMGILASAVQPSVSRSGASLGMLWLLEIPTFDVRLKPFAQPPAVSQNDASPERLNGVRILANVLWIKEVAECNLGKSLIFLLSAVIWRVTLIIKHQAG